MPRGGGSFGGGGGGSSGGGSFGGGFRGGGFSSRSSSTFRSSGRTFGRTGARRTSSSSSGSHRGPYSRSHYHSHYHRRRYFPWYRRHWYYRPWFVGHYYRSWFYSPAYIISAIIFGIVIFTMFIPFLIGAFSGGVSTQTINYRSTETLYYNEYWYEFEEMQQGDDISFSLESAPSVITFAIWDKPFDSIPTKTATGNVEDTTNLQQNYYYYYTIFLKPGSTIDYSFNTTDSVEFFIADGQNMNNWVQSESATLYNHNESTTESEGSFAVDSANDYYIVWYNPSNNSVDVNLMIEYLSTAVKDFSVCEYYEESIETVSSNTITVPNDGSWYFFVYFDPMNTREETTTITFDVTYETTKDVSNSTLNITPGLILFGIVALLIFISAVRSRKAHSKNSKNLKKKQKTITKSELSKTPKIKYSGYGKQPEASKVLSKVKNKKDKFSRCLSCGSKMKENEIFCSACGKKKIGRKVGGTIQAKRLESKICSYCGSKIKGDHKFCQVCGAKIEK